MTTETERASATRALRLPLATYAMASILHYAHNAQLVRTYPHMPSWLDESLIYSGLIVVTLVGGLGYWLTRSRNYVAGLAVLVVYGVLGLDGAGHYVLAPMAAHTRAMNASIWLEFGTATVLLVVLMGLLAKALRRQGPRVASP